MVKVMERYVSVWSFCQGKSDEARSERNFVSYVSQLVILRAMDCTKDMYWKMPVDSSGYL